MRSPSHCLLSTYTQLLGKSRAQAFIKLGQLHFWSFTRFKQICARESEKQSLVSWMAGWLCTVHKTESSLSFQFKRNCKVLCFNHLFIRSLRGRIVSELIRCGSKNKCECNYVLKSNLVCFDTRLLRRSWTCVSISIYCG